jgi:Cu2+-containing amine oxidase
MSRVCFAAALLAGMAGAVFVLPAGPATRTGVQAPRAGGPVRQPALQEIEQTFPVGGAMQTAWKVQYSAPARGPGLTIQGAWFKTSPRAEWLKVLGSVRLSEIFVPYNNGTRIYDIGAQGNYRLLKHTAGDAGPNGKLLNDGLLVHELRDCGILWKYYDKVRRGQDLVLWSTLGAGNYNYLMEYSFRGDGSLTCRMGSTGRNFGNHETTGHMHHSCWRIDMDLDDAEHNSVFLVRRLEGKQGKGNKFPAEDVVEPFNNGVEGGAVWNAEEFTRLRVTAPRKNGQGKPISYELLPLRPGTARHWGPGEDFTHYDFWVTPYQWDEQYYKNLPRFVKQKRPITDTNVVLWYMAPAYHLPRDEDGVFVNPETGRASVRGVAMTAWCGFELRPRNLFEKSPLYP